MEIEITSFVVDGRKVDHPSQSTVVNLGKKQKWCSLWCPYTMSDLHNAA